MPIRFRCDACGQLMGITRRKVGQIVSCTRCGADVLVPADDAAEAAEAVQASAGRSEDSSSGPLPKPERRRAAAFPEDEEPPRFVIRKPKTDFEEMDLTPMVDVTFLLLIFFMITASFSLHKTIEVPTPDPDEQGAAQSIRTIDDLLDTSIKVEIDERNAIAVDDEPISDPVDLPDRLLEKMLSEDKNEMVLTVHESALHETLVRVIDAANDVGLQKIRLTASGSGP